MVNGSNIADSCGGEIITRHVRSISQPSFNIILDNLPLDPVSPTKRSLQTPKALLHKPDTACVVPH